MKSLTKEHLFGAFIAIGLLSLCVFFCRIGMKAPAGTFESNVGMFGVSMFITMMVGTLLVEGIAKRGNKVATGYICTFVPILFIAFFGLVGYLLLFG